MQAFQQQVVDEKNELDEKLVKLTAFLRGGLFCTLQLEEQNRMKAQANAMQMYSNILAERIAAFV